MKLLVDAHDDRVLAVHMIGTDAPEIVQSLAVALTAGATKAALRPHDRRAPHRGRRVRADARAGAHGGATAASGGGTPQLNRRRAAAEPAARSSASSCR